MFQRSRFDISSLYSFRLRIRLLMCRMWGFVGPNCGETRKFVESAKLLGNFAYLEKCKAQLPVMFNQIDYGLRSQGASWRFSSADHIHLGVGVAIGMIGVML